MVEIHLFRKIKSSEIIFINAINIIFNIHLVTCNFIMVAVIFFENTLETGVHYSVVIYILDTAYITQIRNFKGIDQLEGILVFIHQVFVIIRGTALIRLGIRKTDR